MTERRGLRGDGRAGRILRPMRSITVSFLGYLSRLSLRHVDSVVTTRDTNVGEWLELHYAAAEHVPLAESLPSEWRECIEFPQVNVLRLTPPANETYRYEFE